MPRSLSGLRRSWLRAAAVARRLAATFALLFTLAPVSRWGYFVYPAAVLGFTG
jgi:hypothetical protein